MYRKISPIILGIMVLTLGGCNNTLKDRGNIDIDNPIKIEENEEPIIKDEKLVAFDELLNNKENIGFVSSEYDVVTEIDFKNLLLEFPNEYAIELDNSSSEYGQLISNDNSFKDMKIYKLSASKLKTYLKEKTGFIYEEFSKNSLTQVTYMKEYNSYYTSSKFDEKLVIDTTSVSNEGNIYYVTYKNKLDGKKYKLKLAKVDDKYLFVSNISE